MGVETKVEVISLALISVWIPGCFKSWIELVTYVVSLLHSGFNFSVQSSIFGEDSSQVFELVHLLEFDIADINAKAALCSANLHCFCLADIDYDHAIVFT